MTKDEFKDLVREAVVKDLTDRIDEIREWERAVDEARGVSGEVENATNKIVRYIRYQVGQMSIDYSKKKYYKKQIEFGWKLFGSIVKFCVTVHYFKNNDVLANELPNIKQQYEYKPKDNTVYITVLVGGKSYLATNFDSKIAHEIRHVMQYRKEWEHDNDLLHPDEYYELRDKEKKTECEKLIASVMYLTSRFEDESYGEELYSELMGASEPLDSYIYKTNPYCAYRQLKKDIDVLERHGGTAEASDILSKFGYSFDRFLKRSKRACDKFLKRIARVYSLACERKHENNPCENYRPLTEQLEEMLNNPNRERAF